MLAVFAGVWAPLGNARMARNTQGKAHVSAVLSAQGVAAYLGPSFPGLARLPSPARQRERASASAPAKASGHCRYAILPIRRGSP
jgi:hypothetical protein